MENITILKSNSARQVENVPSLLGPHTDHFLNYLAHNEFNVVPRSCTATNIGEVLEMSVGHIVL